MKSTFLFLLMASGGFAALPSVGPDYKRPDVAAPASYREVGNALPHSLPPSGESVRPDWWSLFGDTTLNRLENQALAANQDLKAAAARVEQAAAAAGISRSAFWPQVSAVPAATRSRTSTTTDNPFPTAVANDFTVPVFASWELDLFGRVRRLNESARNEAAAASDLFESVRLSLAAAVASDYFTLRGLDRELVILKETIALRRRELDLVSAQRRSGAATELDTARAQTELAATEAESAAVAGQRESVQDALAVLAGQDATSFSLPLSVEEIVLPSVPPGVPSQLLERRPDIASAERSLAAANAQIGVAKAAFFPAISLTGSAGYDSGETNRLFGADSRIWSFGPSIYVPIFQGGRNQANLERSRAAYDESVAAYRQQVLVAFREVQEALVLLQHFSDQSEAQDRAVAYAKQAARLAQIRYNAGYVSYLDVVDAQRTELGNERTSTQLFARRLDADVALIKALGGGWSDGGSYPKPN
jgi:multidrug efflux system outer membrane protein